MEKLKDKTVENSPEVAKISPEGDALKYLDRLEAREASILVQAASIKDPTLKKRFLDRVGIIGKAGKQAVTGAIFMLAANGALGQEINEADTQKIADVPAIEAVADVTNEVGEEAGPETPEIKDELSEENKEKLIVYGLKVLGESIENEAEKLAQPEALAEIDLKTDMTELPLGLGQVDLKDPLVWASLASKLGGNVGNLGKAAKYAQKSYDTFNKKQTGEDGKVIEKTDTRKMIDIVSQFPFGGKLVSLAQMAGKAMDTKDRLDKGEKVTSGEVLEAVLSLIPQAAILMRGIKIIKELPPATPGEAPSYAEERYQN